MLFGAAHIPSFCETKDDTVHDICFSYKLRVSRYMMPGSLVVVEMSARHCLDPRCATKWQMAYEKNLSGRIDQCERQARAYRGWRPRGITN